MSPVEAQRRPLPAEADTEALGAALARTAPWSAPQPLVVYLCGELGTGKTTLVRGLLRALGVQGTVRSPSYTLLEIYPTAAGQVLHLDLYRLRDPGEVEMLGLRDELNPGAMLLIEWPERADGALPSADLCVRLEVAGEGRVVDLKAQSAVGRDWLQELQLADVIPS